MFYIWRDLETDEKFLARSRCSPTNTIVKKRYLCYVSVAFRQEIRWATEWYYLFLPKFNFCEDFHISPKTNSVCPLEFFVPAKCKKRRFRFISHTTYAMYVAYFTWRNRRLPSPTRINSSVCPSVRPSIRTYLQIRCSAENGTGPTDSVNYSSKSWINDVIVNQKFFEKSPYARVTQ